MGKLAVVLKSFPWKDLNPGDRLVCTGLPPVSRFTTRFVELCNFFDMQFLLLSQFSEEE